MDGLCASFATVSTGQNNYFCDSGHRRVCLRVANATSIVGFMNPVKELETRLKQRTRTALAAELGISDGYLRDVLKDRRPASDRLLDALGLERITLIRRKRKARTA